MASATWPPSFLLFLLWPSSPQLPPACPTVAASSAASLFPSRLHLLLLDLNCSVAPPPLALAPCSPARTLPCSSLSLVHRCSLTALPPMRPALHQCYWSPFAAPPRAASSFPSHAVVSPPPLASPHTCAPPPPVAFSSLPPLHCTLLRRCYSLSPFSASSSPLGCLACHGLLALLLRPAASSSPTMLPLACSAVVPSSPSYQPCTSLCSSLLLAEFGLLCVAAQLAAVLPLSLPHLQLLLRSASSPRHGLLPFAPSLLPLELQSCFFVLSSSLLAAASLGQQL